MVSKTNRANGGLLNLVSDETMKKVDYINKILLLIILLFVVIFCLLLLMDWLLGSYGWDYIPGVGRGSGDAGFIPVFFQLT